MCAGLPVPGLSSCLTVCPQISFLRFSFCRKISHWNLPGNPLKRLSLSPISSHYYWFVPPLKSSIQKHFQFFYISFQNILYTCLVICPFQSWNPISLRIPGCFSWKMAFQDHDLGIKAVLCRCFHLTELGIIWFLRRKVIMSSNDNCNSNSVLSGFILTTSSYIHIPFPPCLVLKGTRMIKLEY